MASYTQRNGRWQVRVRLAGQPTRTRTFPTKAEARAWARQEVERVAPAPVGLTLAGALERYEREITPLKRGARQEIGRLRALAQRPIGTRCLSSLLGADIAKYRDHRLREVSPSTVQKELALISHLYTIARKEWSLTVDNPVIEIRKPKVGQGRDFRLEPEVERRIIEAAPNESLRTYLTLLIETGARRSELLSVRWVDLDLARRTLRLNRTKNGVGRTVPLSRRALEVLRQLPRLDGGKIFALKPDYVSHAFKQLAGDFGVGHLCLHDLRHEAISRFIEKGLSIGEVQAISGHKTVQMLARYCHAVVSPERLD
jgi:integrase